MEVHCAKEAFVDHMKFVDHSCWGTFLVIVRGRAKIAQKEMETFHIE